MNNFYQYSEKNKKIYFNNKKEYNNYVDYKNNGLKVIRISGRSYFFNSGDRLIDTSYGNKKSYCVITRSNKKLTSENLIKKYVKCI